jgi:hypothetical protein
VSARIASALLPLVLLVGLGACTEASTQDVGGDLSGTTGNPTPKPSGAHNAPDGGRAEDPGACAPAVSAPATGNAFCDEVARRGGALGTTTCKTDSAYCMKQQALYSDAYKAEYVACSTSTPFCGSDFAVCRQKGALARAVPTSAQKKVATSFCATCGAGSTTCASDFFALDPANKSPGAGFSTLLAADSVAAQIEASCTGAKLTSHFDAGAAPRTPQLCASAFTECAQDVVRALTPPSGCPK